MIEVNAGGLGLRVEDSPGWVQSALWAMLCWGIDVAWVATGYGLVDEL